MYVNDAMKKCCKYALFQVSVQLVLAKSYTYLFKAVHYIVCVSFSIFRLAMDTLIYVIKLDTTYFDNATNLTDVINVCQIW